MKNNFCQKCEYNQQDVEFFCQRGVDTAFAKILSSRGVDCKNFDKFFNFDFSNFYNPFLMNNMDKAVEQIKEVMLNNQSILIYGDYDADGITASSILKLFFEDNGVYCKCIIPSRADGYGLHVENIREAFEKTRYNLVITVDCGISNKIEAGQILSEFNTKLIITDHHELPAELPDCLCVNPKMGYPFANLSGAGVAFKIVQAIAGIEVASTYADLACVGTIADMMPLVDENRDIVKLGLANFNHKGLVILSANSQNNKNQVTASDIALRIAPKINAAGRLGNVELALNLLSDRHYMNKNTAEMLTDLNQQRKDLLEQLLQSAESKIIKDDFLQDKLIYIYDDNWCSGILGIAANRFKEQYNMPAVVLTKDGDNYVGSARGIDGVDLFELFNANNNLLVKFGGHKASVGFTVAKENLFALQDALSTDLNKLNGELFNPVYYYDLPFEDRFLNKDFIALLDSMQPVFPRANPVFCYTGYCKSASLFGQDKNHLKITLDNGLELKGFYKFAKFYTQLNTSCQCEVLFSLEEDKYSKTTCGIIIQIKVNNSLYFDDLYAQNYIMRLGNSNSLQLIDKSQVEELLNENTIAVFNSYVEFEEYAKEFDFSNYYLDIFEQTNFFTKCVMISPVNNNVLKYYKNVICFGNYSQLFANYGQGYLYQKVTQTPQFISQKIDRDICLAVFKALTKGSRANSLKEYYDISQFSDITYTQFLLAIKVFCELGLIDIFQPFKIAIDNDKKVNLTNSQLYNHFNLV
ncbi:MAG: single-stranded-DNA-specific exonuclease RecJ [Clostridia bacterium]